MAECILVVVLNHDVHQKYGKDLSDMVGGRDSICWRDDMTEAELQAQLTEFFRQHKPDRVARVPVIVGEFVKNGGGAKELQHLNEDLRKVLDLSDTAQDTHAHMHTCTCTHIHTHAHNCTHAHTHSHNMHTHTLTHSLTQHTHTHTPACMLVVVFIMRRVV